MILTGLARANRAQLVTTSMSQRARITLRVKGELTGHSRGDARIAALLPPPLGNFGQLVNGREIAEMASDIQRSWHGKKVVEQEPQIDRGEAECLAACKLNGWPLFSQDRRAVGRARLLGIPLYGLPELLMLFAGEGQMLAVSAWKIYADIATATPALTCRGWPVDEGSEALFAECSAVLAP